MLSLDPGNDKPLYETNKEILRRLSDLWEYSARIFEFNHHFNDLLSARDAGAYLSAYTPLVPSAPLVSDEELTRSTATTQFTRFADKPLVAADLLPTLTGLYAWSAWTRSTLCLSLLKGKPAARRLLLQSHSLEPYMVPFSHPTCVHEPCTRKGLVRRRL